MLADPVLVVPIVEAAGVAALALVAATVAPPTTRAAAAAVLAMTRFISNKFLAQWVSGPEMARRHPSVWIANGFPTGVISL